MRAAIASPSQISDHAAPHAVAISCVITAESSSALGISAHASSTPSRPSCSTTRASTSARTSLPRTSRRQRSRACRTADLGYAAKSSAKIRAAASESSVPVSSAHTATARRMSGSATLCLRFCDELGEHIAVGLGAIELAGSGGGYSLAGGPFGAELFRVLLQALDRMPFLDVPARAMPQIKLGDAWGVLAAESVNDVG